MTEDIEEAITLALQPYAAAAMARARDGNLKFVHYTTADAAASILRHENVWMRNAMVMNDYTEVRHGLDGLAAAYRSEPGLRFQAALNGIFPGFAQDLEARFNPWGPTIEGHTYLTSISEHDASEDDHGRLSMWRSYGGATGVALVFNNGPFLRASDALNAWTSPVAYLDHVGFSGQLAAMAAGIETHAPHIAELDRENLLNSLFLSFLFAAVSTKHSGFHEEREWRIIHSPKIFPSDKLIEDHVTIAGIPQTIYKIPLRDYPDEDLVGASIPALIERVIIGPTDYGLSLLTTFRYLLEKAGVPDPEKRVIWSGIPLRA